ncbi:unnamed protein product [Orchesella dallaii]|uniref:Metalloendopeptidase n=1 Tax=Orchesella dallaii TaxID=48710 RepID=A0ABP1PHD3_9HEXA
MATFETLPKRVKILSIFLILIIKVHISNGFSSCETPDGWQVSGSLEDQENTIDDSYLRRNSKRMWENAQVAYVLHKSLTEENKQEVLKAFEEYHTKTCIRFKPKQSFDKDYVSIEINNEVCGHANVCRQGGYQYARFGSHCRNMNTMVHELGHTLCLYHEHQRKDRDNYLSFGNCRQNETDSIIQNATPLGLYDYQSVMHYQCGLGCKVGWVLEKDVPGCGVDVTPGLSVLDVDNLNALNNCQGCFRHRWINAQQLTQADIANLHNFGHQNLQGVALYPCRTIYKGQIVIGQATFGQGPTQCIIIHYNQVLLVQNNVEVLTIPGGLTQNCYTYSLKRHDQVNFNDAIIAAAKNSNTQEKVYIAYGYVRQWNGMYDSGIGEVTAINGFTNAAHLVFGSNRIDTMEYSVLTCSCVQSTTGSQVISTSISSDSAHDVHPWLNDNWSETQSIENTETWDDEDFSNQFPSRDGSYEDIFPTTPSRSSDETLNDNFGDDYIWSSEDSKSAEDLLETQFSDEAAISGDTTITGNWWPSSNSFGDSDILTDFGKQKFPNIEISNEWVEKNESPYQIDLTNEREEIGLDDRSMIGDGLYDTWASIENNGLEDLEYIESEYNSFNSLGGTFDRSDNNIFSDEFLNDGILKSTDVDDNRWETSIEEQNQNSNKFYFDEISNENQNWIY